MNSKDMIAGLRKFATATALMAATAMPALAADKLVISIETGPTHLQTTLMNQFVDMLEERSGGELMAEVFD